MQNIKIITVDQTNVSEHGFYCLRNPKNEGYRLKMEWLKKRFKEGLRIKIAYNQTGDQTGFIEYVPAEFAWRPVKAPGYMFIHCILLFKKNNMRKGCGSLLIDKTIKDAKKNKMKGIVTFTSDGSWIANKNLFLKHGFELVNKLERIELLVKHFKKGDMPELIDWTKNRKKYKGWNLVYVNQCPLFNKSITDVIHIAKDKGIDLIITELKTANQAQKAPSGYGTYTLIKDGKLLADNYISGTRFKNILKKEAD